MCNYLSDNWCDKSEIQSTVKLSFGVNASTIISTLYIRVTGRLSAHSSSKISMYDNSNSSYVFLVAYIVLKGGVQTSDAKLPSLFGFSFPSRYILV